MTSLGFDLYYQIKETCVDELYWVEKGVFSQFGWNGYFNTAFLDIKRVSPQFKVAFEGEFIPR